MPIKAKQTPSYIFYLFIGILLFAPLAFGTVELWSLTLLEFSIALLGLLLFLHKSRSQNPFLAVPGFLPLLLLLLWMVIQIVPLPYQLVKFLSPGTFAAYQPLYEVVGESGWIPLSVNTKVTLAEILRIGSYSLFYILTIQLLSNGRALQKTVRIVAALAIFIAFLAIIKKFTSPELIYWYRDSPGGNPFGPWINRNQYSGFMAMMLPLIFGLFLYHRPYIDKEESLRSRIVALFSSSDVNKQLVLAFGWAVVLFSILLALSRGGIISAFLTMLLFYVLYSRKRHSRSWPVIMVIVLGVCIFLFNFGSEGIISRINDTFSPEGELRVDRFDTWNDVAGIIKTFWLTGAGFGTFVDIFPLYKTLANSLIYDHAHNDYLELITDGGVIGFGLAAWFVIAVIVHGWGMIKKRRDNFSITIGIGALAGIFSMLCYSITDFNMHNGADGLYFFFLCGVLVSCGNTRIQSSLPSLLGKLPDRWETGILAINSIVLLAVLFFPLRAYMAGQTYSEIENIYLSRQLSDDKLAEMFDKAKRIRSYDPLDGTYLMVLGNIEKYRGNKDAALNYYLQAVLKNPLRGEFLQKVALLLPNSEVILANKLMELSYQRSLKKESMILTYAEWLLWRGEKEQAGMVLQKGLADNIQLFDDAVVLLNSHFTYDEVAKLLPERVAIWIKYGELLDKSGKKGESEFFRKGALEFLEKEEKIRSWWYSQLYYFYLREENEEKAVDVLRLAALKFPENVEFHLRLGDYFKKMEFFIGPKKSMNWPLYLSLIMKK